MKDPVRNQGAQHHPEDIDLGNYHFPLFDARSFLAVGCVRVFFHVFYHQNLLLTSGRLLIMYVKLKDKSLHSHLDHHAYVSKVGE